MSRADWKCIKTENRVQSSRATPLRTNLENVQTDKRTEFVDVVVGGPQVRPYQSAALALFALIVVTRFLFRLGRIKPLRPIHYVHVLNSRTRAGEYFRMDVADHVVPAHVVDGICIHIANSTLSGVVRLTCVKMAVERAIGR